MRYQVGTIFGTPCNFPFIHIMVFAPEKSVGYHSLLAGHFSYSLMPWANLHFQMQCNSYNYCDQLVWIERNYAMTTLVCLHGWLCYVRVRHDCHIAISPASWFKFMQHKTKLKIKSNWLEVKIKMQHDNFTRICLLWT